MTTAYPDWLKLGLYEAADPLRYVKFYKPAAGEIVAGVQRLECLGPYGYRMEITQIDRWGFIYTSTVKKPGGWEIYSASRRTAFLDAMKQELEGGHLKYLGPANEEGFLDNPAALRPQPPQGP